MSITGKDIYFSSLILSIDVIYSYVQHGIMVLPSFVCANQEMANFLEAILSFKDNILIHIFASLIMCIVILFHLELHY
ncbi:hypothetical protein BCV72DRAFT_223818 [Rhizopus microsporus var. microsporus]|uniref:Uncharacterized protein n=2 Tax=Rhizopus microsporus TaxID=58291 RepID=A0A2G4T810_RHIZD|nr:uncharacterized protein RHIMIDRAFT_253139 [Rhizopus microsporus ATCC 52813]ORE09271.1 hypothetical protein BCV72DRAFT_223818 [Rhizopus microsporus var. microsporus]PHZ17153.1 hypothetical protein RHIMIDRAFT_253139 [Rhizopus microsporus ATCC 52813]